MRKAHGLPSSVTMMFFHHELSTNGVHVPYELSKIIVRSPRAQYKCSFLEKEIFELSC